MAITRTALVDDSGQGTDGTILNNAWKTELYDQIDDADAAVASSVLGSGLCEGRLTLTSGTPVTTADVTGATNIYWTPYRGNRIALYDGAAAWQVRTFSELTLALGTVTSALPYDVFAYDNSGTVALEKLAWTNTTTRATALTTQDGVLVKSGATTRRYLGTFYTTSTTATEDSVSKRFLWNYYHRVRKRLYRNESTASWTYDDNTTVRQMNGSTSNQVEAVVGVSEDTVLLALQSPNVADSTASLTAALVGIGLNSTTAFTASCTIVSQASSASQNSANCVGVLLPTVGYNKFTMLELGGNGAGTTTWYGSGTYAGAGTLTGQMPC